MVQHFGCEQCQGWRMVGKLYVEIQEINNTPFQKDFRQIKETN